MAKETIYLTSAVRLAGDDQDTPAGTEVSVEAADAEFLTDVARVATRDELAAAADTLAARQAAKSNARVQTKALQKRLDDKYGRH